MKCGYEALGGCVCVSVMGQSRGKADSPFGWLWVCVGPLIFHEIYKKKILQRVYFQIPPKVYPGFPPSNVKLLTLCLTVE